MKHKSAILPRLLLLAALGGGGYYGYHYLSTSPNLSPLASKLAGQIQGVADNFHLDLTPLVHVADQKLVQKQPIVDTPTVKGDSTSVSLQQSAQDTAQNVANQISSQLQNLPKTEAAKILRQTCEQLATELEK